MLEAVRTNEASVNFYEPTRSRILDHFHFYIRSWENTKCLTPVLVFCILMQRELTGEYKFSVEHVHSIFRTSALNM